MFTSCSGSRAMYQSALDKLIDYRKVHSAAVAVCRLTSSERAVAMTSFGPDGGVVSTSSDMMIFLRAFFGDTIAPSTDLDELTRTWNSIWFPFAYATGIMRFRLPRIFSPFKAQPDSLATQACLARSLSTPHQKAHSSPEQLASLPILMRRFVLC